MDKQQIIADINRMTNDLLSQVARFSDGNFNTKPASEGWSAGEISEHLLVLVKNVNRNLRAKTMPAGRPDNEKLDIISTVFDDYERKYNAPEQIIPSAEPKDKAFMLSELELHHKRLIEVVENYDLAEICKGFNHPSLGAFTRLEWIYFIIHHGHRHIHQMANVLQENTA
jgi:hypothetical protein